MKGGIGDVICRYLDLLGASIYKRTPCFRFEPVHPEPSR
ncbi:Hypothetical protein A7982_08779 [Minicystis rosea]|nr:Hypothetical protein A7982_08779 [Minicystis rosea]